MTSARRIGALLGVVSAAAGLGVSELLSGFLHQRVSPIVAVAESLIRLTPGAVIEKVISVVGTNDKPFLITLTLLGLLILSAGVGVLAMRSVLAAQGVFFVLGVVLVMAVHARLTASNATYIPAVAGVVTAIAVLAVLSPLAIRAATTGRSNQTPTQRPDVSWTAPERTPTRRRFLQLSAAVAVGALVIGGAGRVLAHSRAAVEAARRKLKLPIYKPSQPAGVDVGVDGVASWVTEQEHFYRIDTALSIPQILPKDWELRIHGMVDRELTLSYQDLLDRGLNQAWITLCCVSNEVGGHLISNARWAGVRIADVLADAGLHADADAVLSTSQDNWTCGTPLGALTDGRNALFALAMNGEPLTPEHGFPVRMVVPGLYGYVSATKWVVDLEVTRFDDFTAFWTDRGWSAKGPVKTQSRIDVPRGGDTVSAGDVAIGGVAWAQHTGIAKVQVKIGDADWVDAKLGADPTTDSWVQWSHVWSAKSGSYDIAVRATDESGYTQTSDIADVVPDGATGWHTINVKVD